jgi:5-methylcytosine-specific restriction enzyme subunit McrC
MRRTILEWESIHYGDDLADLSVIPSHFADRLAKVAASSSLTGRGGGGVLEHGRHALRARGIVGVLVAEGCSLEILPKIDAKDGGGAGSIAQTRRRLVHMLALAIDIKIDVGQVTQLDWQNETLLEILIQIFSEKLVDALRQGMPRRYVSNEEDLPSLRGRLDVVRQFTKFAVNPSRLACRYDGLSADIALNRIMKAAVVRLTRIARSTANLSRLRDLSLAFADIAAVPVRALRWNDVVLDRTNARWRELLNMAKLMLGERFQTTSSGEGAGFSLLFEMNTLFEEYVGRMVARALSDTHLNVVRQGGKIYCLEGDDEGLFQTRPDILIKNGDKVVQIIDTKWKRITRQLNDNKRGISQSDVYQMMAYGSLYDCPRLTLLYPHHTGLGEFDGIQATHQITRTERKLETVSVDISTAAGLVERLRGVIGAISAANVTAVDSGQLCRTHVEGGSRH